MKNKHVKVLVAMSGGVDSSVAAALLVDLGYDVTGAFMVNFDDHDKHGLPCYTADYRDAVRVAAKLGIKILKIDFVKEYKENVLDYMYSEYNSGRTPNPDVMCNKYIKFGAWLKKAKELGFDILATGHYANTTGPGNYANTTGAGMLLEAKDTNKDQTYFLHQVTKEQLLKTIFPLGDYSKKEVRKLAKEFDLPTAEKEESMGICFIGEVSMKDFLKDKIDVKNGDVVIEENNEKIGEHDGLPFYTIGQRHGFSQKGSDKPLFVVKKDFETNILYVGYEDNDLLYSDKIEVENMHFISGQAPEFPLKCEVRLRHRQDLQKAIVENETIMFETPQKAATPGQFAVLYKDGVCLGGGIIK